jgi:peptidoglycan/LPS O-acetylase OafA/YrhL
MIWFGSIRNARLTALLAIGWLAAACVVDALHIHTGIPVMDKVITFMLLQFGSSLIPYFLAGSALYLYQDKIAFSAPLAGLFVAGAMAVSVFVDGPTWFDHPLTQLLSVVPMVYLVMYFGMLVLPKLPVFDRGDYSYGVYLYHFPILQALQHLFGFTSGATLMPAAAVPVTLLAMFSWHTIEKPVLKLRKRFSLVGQRLANH